MSCANYQTLGEAAKDLGAHLALTANRTLWRMDKIGPESGEKTTIEWTESGSGVRGSGFK